MLIDFEKDNTTESSNYPTLSDDAFTPDEQDLIKEYKDSLKSKIVANRAVLKALKTVAGSVTSYSLSKFLLLALGSSGMAPAIASVLTINFIANSDVLDSINIDKTEEGIKTQGMGKLIKLGFSTAVSICILWASVGNFYKNMDASKRAYHDLQNMVTNFKKLPDKEQNGLLFAALCGLGVVGVMTVGGKK